MMPWADYIPILGAVIAIASIGIKVGRILQQVDYLIADVQHHDQEMTNIKHDITELKYDMSRIQRILNITKG